MNENVLVLISIVGGYTIVCPVVSSLMDENRNRAISLICQKIEQVTLYKTHYTSIHPNSAGPYYCKAKFMPVRTVTDSLNQANLFYLYMVR